MTKQEKIDWLRANSTIDGRHVQFDNDGLTITSDIIIHKRATKIPFKIHRVSANMDCFECKLETLENFPDTVTGFLYLSQMPNLKSLKYLPNFIYTLDISNIDIDPYEYRYIFYSNIIHEIQISNEEIYAIINKYYGKPEYLHLAMEALMDLGESRGFKYD